ncbi:unnamed protein product, partial [marine sediment metagenome]
KHQVEMTTLDDLFCKPPYVIKKSKILLWLDCEGGELDALEGATQLLKLVDMVNVEMTMKPPSVEWPDTRTVHKKLRQAGFLRQYIHTLKGTQYDGIYVRNHLFKKEYCCCPFSIDEYEKEQKEKNCVGK